MPIPGLHLTRLGSGDFLLEPLKSLNIRNSPQLVENIVGQLLKAPPEKLYYDLSGLPLIDQHYYEWLEALARGTQTINVRLVCINMQPTAAFALSKFIRKKPAFETALAIDA